MDTHTHARTHTHTHAHTRTHTHRANLRVMVFTAFITALAAFNALRVPLLLESQISAHPLTSTIKAAGVLGFWCCATVVVYGMIQ